MADGDTVIDAWMQHPGKQFLDDEMFASLRRWKPGPFSETAPPLEVTVEAMDTAGVSRGLLCAWHGPGGAMISNDDVVLEFPELRIVGGHIGVPGSMR